MRRFVFQQGTSHKFWEIALEGSSFTTRWGKVGTAGQSGTKSFPSEDKARAAYEKIVAEKTKDGYVEESAPTAPAATAPAATAPAATAPAATAPAATAPAATAPKKEKSPKPAATPAVVVPPAEGGALTEARALVAAGKLAAAKKALVAIGGKDLRPPRRFSVPDRAEFLELVAVATGEEWPMRQAIQLDADAPAPTLRCRYEQLVKLAPSNEKAKEVAALLAAEDPRGMARHRYRELISPSSNAPLPQLRKVELAIEGCEYAEKGLLEGNDARGAYSDLLTQLDYVFGDAEENGSCKPQAQPAVLELLGARGRKHPMEEMLTLARKVQTYTNPKKLDSADHDAAQWVALGLLATGKVKEGLAEIERVRKNRELVWDDEHAKVYRKVGRVLLQAGSFAEAATAFERAAEHTKQAYDRPRSLVPLGIALVRNKQLDRATRAFAEAEERARDEGERVGVLRTWQTELAKAGETEAAEAVGARIAELEHVEIVAVPVRKGSIKASDAKPLDIDVFAKQHPTWHDVEALRARVLPVPPAAAAPWSGAEQVHDHPMLRPWREQILRAGAPALGLEMAPGGPIRIGGGVAKTSAGRWPTCGGCNKPLTFVFDIPLATVAALLPGAEGNVVFFYCEKCEPLTAADAGANGSALLSWERGPTQEIEHPKKADDEGWAYEVAPVWTYPWWSPLRLDLTDEPESTAVHHLAGVAARKAGKLIFANQVYDEACTTAASYVGGHARWSQNDETPTCPACEERMHLFARIYDAPMDAQGTAGFFFLCARTVACGGLEKMTWLIPPK